MNIAFHKRRIACVLDYFDEERDLPWNFIQRTGDGRFEAIATHIVDAIGTMDSDEAREHSVGIFDDEAAAIKALRAHLHRIRNLDRWWDRPDGTIDLNMPTIH